MESRINRFIKLHGIRSIVNQIFNDGGIIYGGLLRDIFMNYHFNDIDIIIDVKMMKKLHYSMQRKFGVIWSSDYSSTILGYVGVVPIFGTILDVKVVLTKLRTIDEVRTAFATVHDPMFCTDMLAFNGKKLFNWCASKPSVDEIILAINTKRVTILNRDNIDRVDKMKKRGFIVFEGVGETPPPSAM
jgi:hypothetical protein